MVDAEFSSQTKPNPHDSPRNRDHILIFIIRAPRSRKSPFEPDESIIQANRNLGKNGFFRTLAIRSNRESTPARTKKTRFRTVQVRPIAEIDR